MKLHIIFWLACCRVAFTATAEEPDTPALDWIERSDWINVKTDMSPAAAGNGVKDDTAAIQEAFDGLATGSVLYFPAGTYRITRTLTLQPKQRLTGVWIVGHGRDTRLVWDGPAGQPLWLDHGIAHSRYVGLSFDGGATATVGMHHRNGGGGFETEVDLRHMTFRNFADTGLLASGAPATAEVLVENSLFENCRRGIALVAFNDYNWTIDGCEFRRCPTGIQCDHGNTYIRNTHFEAGAGVDIRLAPEHGCSVRRCTSTGAQQFIRFGNGVSPLTVQDCQVSGWSNPAGAISIRNPGALIFDCVFTNPPGRNPPIQLTGTQQRLLVSQNVSAETDGVVTPNAGTVYEIPAGQRTGTLASARQRFLRDTATVPTKVFDAKVDFGATGDGRTDDTRAIQQAIDAARAHGQGGIAYLPTGTYVVTKPLRVTGADYTVGGTGFRTGLAWRGPEGGAILEVTGPQRVRLENLNVGSHDVGHGMKNAWDILQTDTGASSEVTYDDVSVFGMYQRAPFKQGLCLHDLGPGAVVRVLHMQGNIRLQNAARATVLLGNTYEGSLVVEGKAKHRDGFVGIMSRLGTSCTHALYIKDNHSLVASDFYIEQADNGYRIEGNSDDPPGRLTLQAPKLQMGKRRDGQPNTAFDIRGYHGRIAFGPAQFYVEPTEMPLVHTGKHSLKMILWGCSFYDTLLSVQKDAAADIQFVGCTGVGDKAPRIDDTLPPNALAPFSIALDDLRRLGEADLQLNHPGLR